MIAKGGLDERWGGALPSCIYFILHSVIYKHMHNISRNYYHTEWFTAAENIQISINLLSIGTLNIKSIECKRAANVTGMDVNVSEGSQNWR